LIKYNFLFTFQFPNGTIPRDHIALVRTIYKGQMSLVAFVEVVGSVIGMVAVISCRFTLVGVYARLIIFGAIYMATGTGSVVPWRWSLLALGIPTGILAIIFGSMLITIDLMDTDLTATRPNGKMPEAKIQDAMPT